MLLVYEILELLLWHHLQDALPPQSSMLPRWRLTPLSILQSDFLIVLPKALLVVIDVLHYLFLVERELLDILDLHKLLEQRLLEIGGGVELSSIFVFHQLPKLTSQIQLLRYMLS